MYIMYVHANVYLNIHTHIHVHNCTYVFSFLFLHTELQQFTVSINTCGYSDMYICIRICDMWAFACVSNAPGLMCACIEIRTKISICILCQNQYVYTHSS